ncbi:MAG: segregation ATPase FtsK/SpoIIIE, family [Clostridiales bacterium]|nr:segregation ATPase FtsK/SpoIIIE, family [Clostridiales bacterium]
MASSQKNTQKKKQPAKTKTTTARKTSPKKPSAQELARNYKIRYELKMLGLIFFTLLSLVGLYTEVVGIVGDAFRTVYLGLFSYLGYVMPFFIFAYVFIGLNRNLKPARLRLNIAVTLLLLAGTLISTLSAYGGAARNQLLAIEAPLTGDAIKLFFAGGLLHKTGGVIGNLLTIGALKLIGIVGVYLLILVMCIASFMIWTKISIQDLWELRRRETMEKRAMQAIIEAALDVPQEDGDSQGNVQKNNRQAAKSREPEPHFLSTLDAMRQVNRKKHIKSFDYDTYEQMEKAGSEPVAAEVPTEAAVMDLVNKAPSVQRDASEKTAASARTHASAEVVHPEPPASEHSKDDITFYDGQRKPVKEASVVKEETREKIKEKDIAPETRQAVNDEIRQSQEKKIKHYELPPLTLLKEVSNAKSGDDKQEYLDKARLLEETLNNFNVDAKVISVKKGPSITMFEVQPSPGVKVSKIVGLSDDIALNLATSQVRIAPIQGKAAIGIEIPNKTTTMVTIKEVLSSPDFRQQKSKLTIGLGKDISGNPIIGDLSSMPHLLIAGATGSGKSVCVNTIISSILFHATPDEVKFLMIDPKVVELSNYNGIPHLILPVVTDAKKASIALSWAVNEMTRRYKLFAETSVRDMKGYNKKVEGTEEEHLPQIVVIIDELADLMMVAPNQVEDAICRLAQMARAAGIHLIVATQRPSVDVITGLIKANIPSRIAFSVSSAVDSRTIIDMGGAEKLLGKGDMLYYPVGAPKPKRAQGAFMSDEEVEAVVTFIKQQTEEVNYNESILDDIKTATAAPTDDADEYLEDAINFAIDTGQASASMMQRRFRVGYNRAARLIESMEERGIVGPPNGSKPREVLITRSAYNAETMEEPAAGDDAQSDSID